MQPRSELDTYPSKIDSFEKLPEDQDIDGLTRLMNENEFLGLQERTDSDRESYIKNLILLSEQANNNIDGIYRWEDEITNRDRDDLSTKKTANKAAAANRGRLRVRFSMISIIGFAKYHFLEGILANTCEDDPTASSQV